jgi:hypothetical protein
MFGGSTKTDPDAQEMDRDGPADLDDASNGLAKYQADVHCKVRAIHTRGHAVSASATAILDLGVVGATGHNHAKALDRPSQFCANELLSRH